MSFETRLDRLETKMGVGRDLEAFVSRLSYEELCTMLADLQRIEDMLPGAEQDAAWSRLVEDLCERGLAVAAVAPADCGVPR